MDNRSLGQAGERAAEAYLVAQGARVADRNVRCPVGEIDLVVVMDGCYCFVEVKSRSTPAFGTPAQAVSRAKRGRIVRAAQWYIKAKKLGEVRVRFDVVEVTPGGIRHLHGAFYEKDP